MLFINIVQILIQVAWVIILVQFVLSILIAFNVINTHNEFVGSVWQALYTITEPVYRPIRRILPNTGAIDFSPLVAIIILMIIERAVLPALYSAYIGAPI
ncbi:MAG: YggT family protein [Sphingomonas sp.]|nr:YggT family protein [Sphingomonas sp.]MBO9713045.1 YggT family protein [Sphingomonas sp.]